LSGLAVSLVDGDPGVPMSHNKQDSHNLSISIATKIERDIQASDIAMMKMKYFFTEVSLS
jgi:hypothetical protein